MFGVDAGGIALTERVKWCVYDTQAHAVGCSCTRREGAAATATQAALWLQAPEPANSFDHSRHAWPNREHRQEKLQCGRKECASGGARCQLVQRALLLLCVDGQQRSGQHAGKRGEDESLRRWHRTWTTATSQRVVRVAWRTCCHRRRAQARSGRRRERERHGVLRERERERVCVCVCGDCVLCVCVGVLSVGCRCGCEVGGGSGVEAFECGCEKDGNAGAT